MLLSILLQEAQPAAGGGAGGAMGLLPMLLIFVVFIVFFMIIPQRKRSKEQKLFFEGLKKGDKVVTISGIHGKITEVKENTVMISIAPDTVIEIEKTGLAQNTNQVGGQA